MLTLSSTSPLPAAYDRTDANDASREAVAARNADKAAQQAAAARSSKLTNTTGAAPDVMDGMSTVAMVGASLGSIPAALQRMRDIAMSASSGTLSDADRATLDAEYSQLSHQVSSIIGSPTGADAGTSSKDKRGDDQSDTSQGGVDASTDQTPAQAGTTATTPNGRTHSVMAPRSGSTSAPGSGRAQPLTHLAHAATGAYHATVVPDTQTSHAAALAQFQQHFATQKGSVSLVA